MTSQLVHHKSDLQSQQLLDLYTKKIPLPLGIDENFLTVDADPAAESTNYPTDKRGNELAVLAGFGPSASLIARPGSFEASLHSILFA